MPISQMLLPEFDHEMANTRKLLECVPEGKFEYQPHCKSMCLGACWPGTWSEVPSYATVTINTEVFDVPENYQPYAPASKKELLEKFDKHVAEARRAIASASDEDLAKIWKLRFAGKEMFAMPRVAVIRSMVMNHMIHHRAQLGVYLRLNEVAIPGMYGPSADEMPAQSARTAN